MRYPRFSVQFIVLVLVLVCLALAEDPLTVSVGYSDGGFAAFQSKGFSPIYLATVQDKFVVNSSPDATTLAISLAKHEKGAKKGDSDGRSSLHESTVTVEHVESNKLNIQDVNAPGVTFAQHEVTNGPLNVGGVNQWFLHSLDHFNTDANGWFASAKGIQGVSLSDKIQTCGAEADKHLGGHCLFASVEANKVYTNLPTHKFIRITARMHFIDKWYGEQAYMKLDNAQVWQKNHYFCTKPFADMCRGINTCGDNKFSDTMSVPISIVVPHALSEISITFGADLGDKNACEVSWAVDDVAIELLR